MSYCSYTAQNYTSPLCKALHTRHWDFVAEKWVQICSTLFCGENDYCMLDEQNWVLHMTCFACSLVFFPLAYPVSNQRPELAWHAF